MPERLPQPDNVKRPAHGSETPVRVPQTVEFVAPVTPPEAAETPAVPQTMDGGFSVTPSVSAEAVLAAPRFGRYRLLRKLAAGGMGEVYEAQHIRLGHVVALKKIKSERLAGAEDRQRFIEEARHAASIRQPNILSILEFDEVDGEPYYTLPLITGGNLHQHRQRFRANPHAFLHLLVKVALAVDHLHEAGVIHRDLKPSNIMLGECDEPLLTDFGLAKALGAQLDRTQQGDVLGTVPYMAPEQAEGRIDRLCPQTDVWALGVMLYEFATGQMPFPGKNDREVRTKILAEAPPPPRKLNPKLERSLERIIYCSLAKDPAERYQNARHFAYALTDHLAGRRIKHTPWINWRYRLAAAVKSRWLWAGTALTFAALALALWVRPAEKQTVEVPAEDVWFSEVKGMPEELKQGRDVLVIPEKGHPKWRQTVGSVLLKEKMANQLFTIKAETHALLDLVPAPMPPEFVVDCEMQGKIIAPAGEFGVFLRIDHSARSKQHLGLLLALHETGQRTGCLSAVGWAYAEGMSGAADKTATRRDIWKCQATLDVWQHLQITVRKRSLSISLDGRKIGAIPYELVGSELNSTAQLLGMQQAQTHVWSGLGIVLLRAEASFRSFKVSIPQTPESES